MIVSSICFNANKDLAVVEYCYSTENVGPKLLLFRKCLSVLTLRSLKNDRPVAISCYWKHLFMLMRPIWCVLRHLNSSELIKGLFIWARLTGLARFPRSRLAALFFTKISMCSYEKAGWPGNRDLGFCDRDLGNRAGNFSNSSHMNTPARIPGRNFFNCAWLVRSLTGRNAVPRVFWWPFWTFFISVTGIKFSIWTEDKIRPAYRASPVTGLIWRGP